MGQTIGVGIIARNVEKSIGNCIRSFAKDVDDIVVVLAGKSTDKTALEAKKASKKVRLYDFEWIDDFAAARNYCFSKLSTDWLFWCDADDVVQNAQNLRKLAEGAPDEVGAIWLPYWYAKDEFGNLSTLYERERLVRRKYGWIWKGRLHETVSPQFECKFVRADDVVLIHDHTASGENRGDRNFRILNIMYREDPTDKRIWLYLGHQHFAGAQFQDAAKWYLKFAQDIGAVDIERYQAMCYASKALREIRDSQAIDVAMRAIELFPAYRDGYLELAQSYLRFGNYEKALHWCAIADTKGLIKEPPHIIFINPLDYTFNKFCMEAECFIKLERYEEAVERLQAAYRVRPIEGVDGNIKYVQALQQNARLQTSIKYLAMYLLENKELVKLPKLLEVVPYWLKDEALYEELLGGVKVNTEGVTSEKKIQGNGDSCIVDVSHDLEPEKTLVEAEEKFETVSVVCSMPHLGRTQVRAMSRRDMIELIASRGGRHLLNLRVQPDCVWAQYDRHLPNYLKIIMYLGQGLELWNPNTIALSGCGGSETAAAKVAERFAQQGCQPILYAMDNQVWDGVTYVPHQYFNPQDIPCELFISSRVPEVIPNMKARQKWLWFHDIHREGRLTPEIANNVDVLILLSKWHVNFIKATYPFLKDCEVIDLDEQPLTFEDCEAPDRWYPDGVCHRLPKIAIIGNGLDTERFEEISEERIPHRFIWCSSPDRGLEHVFELWPLIREALPDAELKIFYGWNYFDPFLHIPMMRHLKDKLQTMSRQPGIQWCGRVGQEQIAKELMKADLMLYPPPHSFRETYGIAFLEAQAAGCLVFYRKNGALGETIGDRGIGLEMDAKPREIVNTIVTTLEDKQACDILRLRAREYALGRTWAKQADKMLALYERMIGGAGG